MESKNTIGNLKMINTIGDFEMADKEIKVVFEYEDENHEFEDVSDIMYNETGISQEDVEEDVAYYASLKI